jgi:GMP reductase
MIIEQDIKLDFNDVMFVPKKSRATSRQDINLVTKYLTLHSNQRMEGIPIISANMSSVSTFAMAKALANRNMYCALHKHYSIEDLVWFFNSISNMPHSETHIFYTLGINDLANFDIFLESCSIPKLLCLDVANGYMNVFHDFIKLIRERCPDSIIMAGNVVTPEGCEDIINAGADIVKVGIGSSAVCRTRTVAGVGYPQFSAIMECSQAVQELGALMCSDGGCNVPGDFGKAYGAGANFVMSGTMFAGHDECGGTIINGNKMEFYGMSSETAMNKHHGGMPSYKASEGIVTLVDYKGSVNKTVDTILGGIVSAGSYIDALELSEFHGKAHFIQANRLYNNIFGA